MLHRGSNYAYFGGYHFAKQWFARRYPTPTVMQRLIQAVSSGVCAGTCFWLVCYPIDVVKNRYQVLLLLLLLLFEMIDLIDNND